jgi:hypothetical protein
MKARAAEILRESIARHCEPPLKSLLKCPAASVRAAMILAVLAGFQLSRKVIGSKALVDANAASLSRDLKRMFQGRIASSGGGKSPGQARMEPPHSPTEKSARALRESYNSPSRPPLRRSRFSASAPSAA